MSAVAATRFAPVSMQDEGPARLAPADSASHVERIRLERKARVELAGELNALCQNAARLQCAACVEAKSCERMVATLLVKLLNSAADQLREESALIAQHQTQPRHAQARAEHLASNDRLLNELSAHVMDCGRAPPGAILAATTALLQYWNEVHFGVHDEPLLALLLGRPEHA